MQLQRWFRSMVGGAWLVCTFFVTPNARAQAVDSRLVGTWQGTMTNEAGTWGLNFTVDGVGDYRTRISGPSVLPDEVGNMSADKGKYSLRSQLGKADSGTYQFEGADVVIFRGQTGIPLTFHRVRATSPSPASAASREQTGEDPSATLEPSLARPVAGSVDPGADAIYQRGLAAFRAHDYHRAFPDLKEAARRGSPKAQNVLGEMYEDGSGVPKDLQLARTYYEQSAKQGYRAAQFALGSMYEDGTGVAKNSSKAAALFRLAAEQKLGVAEAELGMLYELGEGVPRDRRKAIFWLDQAGSQGDGRAQWIADWLRDPATPHFKDDLQLAYYIDSQVAKYHAEQLPKGGAGGD